MPVPSISTNFADLLDPRFARVFNDAYDQLPDRVGEFFNVVTSSPTRADYRTTAMGALGDVPEFLNTVTYDDSVQGYDGTITPREYASGYQIERKLFDDDQFDVMDSKPRSLGQSLQRTRQKHAAQLWNQAFSVDTTWNSFTENLALCSNSHTTTHSGTSTAAGFDNLSTAALTAVAVQANRIQMRGFRDDRGNRISVMPDMLLIPPDLEQDAYEIVESSGKPDTANNNANINQGRYRVVDWEYLTDVNNWFMLDSSLMKEMLFWYDRVAKEFAMVEDFDTLVGKWRIYARYGQGHRDWRFVLGNQVS